MFDNNKKRVFWISEYDVTTVLVSEENKFILVIIIKCLIEEEIETVMGFN